MAYIAYKTTNNVYSNNGNNSQLAFTYVIYYGLYFKVILGQVNERALSRPRARFTGSRGGPGERFIILLWEKIKFRWVKCFGNEWRF